MYERSEKRFEALQWLKENKNESAFASNYFGETSTALHTVSKLYDLGANKVEVTHIYDEPSRIRSEGGPYADTLIVHMPESISLDLVEHLIRIRPDEICVKDDYIELWWD